MSNRSGQATTRTGEAYTPSPGDSKESWEAWINAASDEAERARRARHAYDNAYQTDEDGNRTRTAGDDEEFWTMLSRKGSEHDDGTNAGRALNGTADDGSAFGSFWAKNISPQLDKVFDTLAPNLHEGMGRGANGDGSTDSSEDVGTDAWREREWAEWEKLESQVPDEMHENRLAESSRGRTEQMSALDALISHGNKLDDVYQSEGMTTADRAAARLAENESAAAERRQRAALLQNFAARGMSGSGSEMAAGLSAQQGQANRLAQQQAQQKIAARTRALQALQQKQSNIGQRGALGGQVYSQDRTRGRAIDTFNQQRFANQSRIAAGKTQQLGQRAAEQRQDDREDEQQKRDMFGRVIGGFTGGLLG